MVVPFTKQYSRSRSAKLLSPISSSADTVTRIPSPFLFRNSPSIPSVIFNSESSSTVTSWIRISEVYRIVTGINTFFPSLLYAVNTYDPDSGTFTSKAPPSLPIGISFSFPPFNVYVSLTISAGSSGVCFIYPSTCSVPSDTYPFTDTTSPFSA